MTTISLPAYCPHEAECPMVLEACERKVRAEAISRMAEVKVADMERDYGARREVMNALYAAAAGFMKTLSDCRKMAMPSVPTALREAEKRLNQALEACRGLGKRTEAAQ